MTNNCTICIISRASIYFITHTRQQRMPKYFLDSSVSYKWSISLIPAGTHRSTTWNIEALVSRPVSSIPEYLSHDLQRYDSQWKIGARLNTKGIMSDKSLQRKIAKNLAKQMLLRLAKVFYHHLLVEHSNDKSSNSRFSL